MWIYRVISTLSADLKNTLLADTTDLNIEAYKSVGSLKLENNWSIFINYLTFTSWLASNLPLIVEAMDFYHLNTL